jgi:hypothetical protein
VSGIPDPAAGLVIRYSYLWSDEHRQGRNEGYKNRPCAVIVVIENIAGGDVVVVLPITHTPPRDPSLAMEIPHTVKERIGLDDARSWVVLDEANRFLWPGMDIAPTVAGDMASIVYGALPANFVLKLRSSFFALLKAKRVRLIPRDE